MRILLVHNRYRQAGGEDVVFAAERDLLRRHGHAVFEYVADNRALGDLRPLTQALNSVWSASSYARIAAMIRSCRPHVVHVHNTLALLSPSVYYAARAHGIAVVQTLHNYRLVCPNARLFREGQVCEACAGRPFAWPAVAHGCYRGRASSAVAATTVAVHRVVGTWQDKVHVYVAPTDFAKEKIVAGGIASDRIVVKPHFVDPDTGPGSGRGGYAVFVGRLEPEKGIRTVLAAWEQFGVNIPLWIVGDGPLTEEVSVATRGNSAIRWLGAVPQAEVADVVGNAGCLIFASEAYETFGRVIVEAFAKATPVIAAGMGAAKEIVYHGRTGLHFRPGDAEDLADKLNRIATNPLVWARLRREARSEYERKYTPGANYRQLIAIYEQAITAAAHKRPFGALRGSSRGA